MDYAKVLEQASRYYFETTKHLEYLREHLDTSLAVPAFDFGAYLK
jgi:hypothetical protein